MRRAMLVLPAAILVIISSMGFGRLAPYYTALSHDDNGGGTRFEIKCNTGEVLVGVYGKSGWYVDAVGLRCRSAVGSTSSSKREMRPWWKTPENYSLVCGPNYAVAHLAGRSGWYVDNLRVYCRPINSSKHITGSGYLAGSTGGTAESTRWDIACPGDQPAIGLYGYIHNYVERVGLICDYGAP